MLDIAVAGAVAPRATIAVYFAPNTDQEFIDAMLRTAPLGLRMTKETLNTVLKINDLNAVIDLEGYAQSICGRGPDFEEAMKAFLEKRPPNYAKR